MRESRQRKVISTAGPLMEPGEQPQLITMAKLGSTPAIGKTVATAVAVGVAASLAGAHPVGFFGFSQREVYILLTDRQVIFFEAVRATGAPGKYLASYRRDQIVCMEPRSSALGLFMKLEMAAPGMDGPLKLSMPPLPPSTRTAARQLAAALPRPPA